MEFNRWLIHDDSQLMLFFDKVKMIKYGIGMKGGWFCSEIIDETPHNNISNRYATEKEIHEKLLKYAVKNGYVSTLYGFSLWYRDSIPTYKGNQLFINGSSVMLDGVWDASQKFTNREISINIPIWQVKRLRNYLGENDSSQTAHWAFKLFDDVLKNIN